MSRLPATRLAVLLPALLASACILQFENGVFQTITLHFSLSGTLAEGEEKEVHSVHYPMEVQLRRNWVRLAGVIEPPDGGLLPEQIDFQSRFEKAESSKKTSRIKATAKIDAEGRFSVAKRIKKNIEPDTLQLTTVKPLGAALPEGTKIWLCIDVVETKSDVRSLPDCVADSSGDDEPEGEAVEVRILNNRFDPQRVRIEPGDTVRWTLAAGATLNHTVTAASSSGFDSGFLSSPGAFFEVTFDESHRNQTFQYYCLTHQGCCAMQGSVLVGSEAPDPGNGY